MLFASSARLERFSLTYVRLHLTTGQGTNTISMLKSLPNSQCTADTKLSYSCSLHLVPCYLMEIWPISRTMKPQWLRILIELSVETRGPDEFSQQLGLDESTRLLQTL